MVLKKKKLKTSANKSVATTDDVVMAIDSLAAMTKRGFDEMGERISNLDEKVSNLDENNAREHEEIKIRLDNVVHRFELVELQKRVEVLERRMG